MKFEKIAKILSETALGELAALDAGQLEKTIVASERSIAEAKQQLDDNEEYQELREQVKAVSAGYRDAKTYQTAKIQYALIRLEELGK